MQQNVIRGRPPFPQHYTLIPFPSESPPSQPPIPGCIPRLAPNRDILRSSRAQRWPLTLHWHELSRTKGQGQRSVTDSQLRSFDMSQGVTRFFTIQFQFYRPHTCIGLSRDHLQLFFFSVRVATCPSRYLDAVARCHLWWQSGHCPSQ